MENNNQQIQLEQLKKPFNKNEFINALKQDFATTVRKVYVNSLQRDIGFREVSVKEQKTVSRIMIDNDNRRDMIYDTQCSLINKVCLEDGFDVYKLNEFDKNKLLMALYQANMFKSEIKFKCKHCDTENAFKLDFQQVLDRMDSIDTSDKHFIFENDTWRFDFTIGYPIVSNVSEFYKYQMQRHKQNIKSESVQQQINADYVNMYIKAVSFSRIGSDIVKNIDMSMFSMQDIEEIISSFPQDVIYADNGVLQYIATEFIKTADDQFEQHKCAVCGAVYEEAIDRDQESFL